MSDVDVRKAVQEELGNIAPEIDFATVDPAADLHEAIDIDSMDFLDPVSYCPLVDEAHANSSA
jgi:hypothetical protein